MYAVTLGEEIDPLLGGKIPPSGGGCLSLSLEDQIFIIGLPNLSQVEIQSCREQPINIGLLQEGDATFLLLGISNILEFDFSYNYDVGPKEGRGISPIPYEQGYGFSLIVFDTMTNIIQALRFFTVTPEFSEELHYTVESMKERYESGNYNFPYWHNKAMNKYSNPSKMWKDCIIKEKAGISFKP